MRRCAAAIAFAFTISLTSGVFGQCGELVWTQGVNLPVPRTGAAMVYDSARARVVLFGGTLTGGGLSSATLEYDGISWTQRTVSGAPTARTGHAMAYDAARGVVVLFGGTTASGSSAGTFEYDGTAWQSIANASPPTARYGHAMAYDAARHVVVLFGGRTSSSVGSETYEYNGVWTARGVPGPGPRTGHALAYDPVAQRAVLFGGQTNTGSSPNYASSTWTWDGTTWTLAAADGAAVRTGGRMTYVPQRQHIMLMGGEGYGILLGSLSEWTGSAWQSVEATDPPTFRTDAGLAYDAARNKLMLVGGQGQGGLLSNVSMLTPTAAGITFTTNPATQQVPVGQTMLMSGAASGPVSAWLWRRNGQPLSNNARTVGVATPTLTVSLLTESDAGTYTLDATGACGTVQSAPATLTILSACGTADFNNDGDVGTDGDIEAFFACLGGTCCDTCGTADFNNDGDTGTDADIEAFFRVLGGGNC